MKANILYIDDEPVNLLLFEKLFETKYNVLTGLSGFDGLKLLSKHGDIGIVISDMQMPEMDGIQFIEKAKQYYPHIKFYILTGYDITPRIEEALNTNLICHYFQKPFNMMEIDNKIVESLNRF